MTDKYETDKKQKFIEAFVEAIENHVPEKEALQIAKLEAGYSVNTHMGKILDAMGEDFLRYADRELKITIPKAILKLRNVIDDPDQRGASNALAAVGSVLDRAGVIKKESKEVNINMPSGVAFMPAKVPVEIADAAE